MDPAQTERPGHLAADDEEGWFSDPYARHEARWLSGGRPTKLVRDGGVESYDEPPDGPMVQEPVRIEEEPAAVNGEDLRRTDAAERDGSAFDKAKASRAEWDAFDDRTGPPI